MLVIQNVLLEYLRRNFQFNHIGQSRVGDPVQVHSYNVQEEESSTGDLHLAERLSTDSQGIATSLGLQMDPNIELARIIEQLEAKISDATLLRIV